MTIYKLLNGFVNRKYFILKWGSFGCCGFCLAVMVYILTTRVYNPGSGLSTGSFGLFPFPLLCKKFQNQLGNPIHGGIPGDADRSYQMLMLEHDAKVSDGAIDHIFDWSNWLLRKLF